MRFRSYYTCAIILALLCFPAVQAAAADIGPAVNDRLDSLKSSGNANIRCIGTSGEGRQIRAAVICDPSTDTAVAPRVLIIAGQHGNEPAPVRASLDLMDNLTHSTQRAIVAVIPLANPDGFVRKTRCNASGADLNRDWQALSQPETKAIRRFVRQFCPQIIIDEHEWTVDDPFSPNCIETPLYGQRSSDRLSRLVLKEARTLLASNAVKLRPLLYSRDADPRLAHREFSKEGYSAFLVETSQDDCQGDRVKAYNAFVMSVLRTVSDTRNADVQHQLAGLRRVSPAVDRQTIFASNRSDSRSPSGTAYLLLLVFITMRLAGTLGARKITERASLSLEGCWARPRSHTVTDIAAMDVPARQRREMMRECRRRPTDRGNRQEA